MLSCSALIPLPCMRRAQSVTSAAPTRTFLGSHPRKAHVPPNGRESTIAISHPAARHLDAAADAASPVPITIRSNFRFMCSSVWPLYFTLLTSCDGKPTSDVAFIIAASLVFASSKVTATSFCSKFTAILEPPGTLCGAFLTVLGQLEQVIPGTFRVVVWVAAPMAGVKREVAKA